MAEPQRAQDAPPLVDRRDASPSNAYRRSIFGVPVTITVSIGQKRLSVSEVLDLQPEAVVPLTARIDDPVDLLIGDKLIARGELIETGDGMIGVKVVEIVERARDDNG